MQIEQAVYGEHRGGHSLLASSGDEEVSTEIVQRLDLPDTAPPGIEWSPFLRGFPHRNRYVLARTFRDTSASRGGMVFSHALLVPLDEIVETPHLGPLLKLLGTSDRQRPDATAVELVRTETPLPDANDLMDAAEALGANGRSPVVRLGHVGFDDLVVALWAHLFPEVRRGFAFRLSFDPRDLVETPAPALVCAPQAMAARWSDYPVIRSGTSPKPTSLVAAALSGNGKAAPLLEFMRGVGAKPATFLDLRLVEQAYVLNVGEPRLERCAGAIRLIEKLSPDSDAGETGKDVHVQRLCEVMPAARAEEILLLRNLQLSAFPSPGRVWKALKTWTAENSYPQDQDAGMLSILRDATADGSAVEEWRSAVLDGLAAAASSSMSSFPQSLWRWFQNRPETVVALLRYVPADPGIERRLAACTPRKLDESAAESLLTLIFSRGWFRLHGAILSAIRDPSNAARRQVAVDTDPLHAEGLALALRWAKPAEVVECALNIEDPRVPKLAGEAVAKKPNLLANVDFTGMQAQAIWREALALNAESWRGPTAPAAAFHSILDRMLEVGEADPSLIDRLSYAPIADLGEYSRRPEVWTRIGDVALDNLLAATASGWLQRAASEGVPSVPESVLQTAIFENDEFEPTLDGLIPGRIGVALRIVTALDRYDEQRFLGLIENTMSRTTSLGARDSEGIGRLILQRQWKETTADLVARYESGRSDLKPALRTCHDMLDFWVRWRLWLTPISETEKWQALGELAAELYPSGPDDQGLWDRAGGDDADLSSKEDGRTRWRKALRNIRNGKGPTPAALLASMMEDFPNNERIPHLAEDHVFRRVQRTGSDLSEQRRNGGGRRE